MSTSDTAARSQSTSGRVWKLAWPTILSNLLFTTVGFMHIKLAGGLGTSAVAAVSTGHRIFFLVQAILMGLSVAATALISRSWGASDRRRAEMVTWTAVAASIVVAVCLSIPIIAAPEWIAGLFGLDEESTLAAAKFIFWMSLFNGFTAVSLILSTALRATGDVITPLWFLFASSVLNVSCGYLAAYGVGPLPALGVSGLAMGGSIAASAVTVVFVITWWRGFYNVRAVRRWQFNVPITRQLAVIGIPSVVEQGVVQLAFLVFFSIIAKYGTVAYAAYGIGVTLISFPIVVGFGFGIATATLVGQQLGAGRPDLAMAVGWRSLRMSLIAMAVISVLLLYYARDLASFMIDDAEVVELTVSIIYIVALCQPLMAIEFTLGSAMRGAGDTRYPLLFTLCGVGLGRLMMAGLFTHLGMSVHWLFFAMVIDYAIKASLLLMRFRSRKWLETKIAASSEEYT